MSIPGLNKEKCEQRNRIAARRGFDAVPVRFLAEAETEDGEGFAGALSVGELPATVADALKIINASLPENSAPLFPEDVFIHFAEAANSNFIGDRFMFLAESTLRNIAADAVNGVAFQNSHRTGGLSHPAELPFGRTFAGQYQETEPDKQGRKKMRAVIGFYMRRGVRPNGENGPSTDDLHKMITSGQLFDVSVGLHGGEATCDVCGKNVRSSDCSHAPGTTRRMEEGEIEAQKQRGIPKGAASYTYNNGRLGELSGVYDGAVPGAGFRKVLSLSNQLTSAEREEAREAYGSLLDEVEELYMSGTLIDEIKTAVKEGFQAAFGSNKKAELASEPAQVETEQPAKPDNREREDKAAKAEAENAALRKQLAEQREAKAKVEAEAFVAAQIQAGKLFPAEEQPTITQWLVAASDDFERPLAEGSRVANLRAMVEARPSSKLTQELTVGPTDKVLKADENAQTEMSEERRKELLNKTPVGKAALSVVK